MPLKPKRLSSLRGKPVSRQKIKPRAAGPKFALRPYKPRKPKAKQPRSPAEILKEARATRESLVRRGNARLKQPARESAAPPSLTSIAPHRQSTERRIFPPILTPLGNPPVISTGRGQFDQPPEVWGAKDYWVLIEAAPECVGEFAKHQAGFRYIMVASCFYRQSCRPYPNLEPFLIFTLEHSALLEHTAPGLLARLAGERAKPVDMAVGMFTPTARIQIGTVDYDEDFTRGRQRLLKLARHHLGISEHFDLGGHLTKGHRLPATL